MVELTLNLDEIDLNPTESTAANAETLKNKQEPVSEFVMVTDAHNLHSMPENGFDNGVNTEQDLETVPPITEKPKLEKKISESDYTNNLVNHILNESVRVFDASHYVDQLVEEENKYEDLMNCIIKV